MLCVYFFLSLLTNNQGRFSLKVPQEILEIMVYTPRKLGPHDKAINV